MKEYLILKSFDGSQNGIDSESFVAGTTRKLSDSLVKALGGVEGGYVRDAETAAKEIAKAPTVLAEAVKEAIADTEIQPRELPEGEMLEEGEIPEGVTVNPADLRETKVVEPEETKPAKPVAKKGKK